ncbi:hypothetical protein HUA74_02715 [Myxococcus sp. CA051A]|uniref:hypothetical protein n=1 Tax=Myxococcus sp. CA051A TaxID=2741739 RepID=UPI00157AEBDE|nr:hypothetical protein [Myxococcus sp. CA051A]NTX59566.1 hypothetical protein [Myxococcus sp. CA051A]
MSGGLKAGDLYIIATASVGQALKSLGELVKGAEDAANAVKEAAEPIGALGAVVAAGIGAAVAAAVQSNEDLNATVTELTDLLYTLASDIGDLFAPAVGKLSEYLFKLVATFQRLSPETKRAAANVALWVAGAGLAVGATGKLAGAVEAGAKAMGLMVKVLTALNTSATVAGVASGFSSAAVALRKLADMQPAALMTNISNGASSAAKGMGGLKSALVDVAHGIRFTAAYFAYFAAPVAAIAIAVAGLALLAGSLYGAWKDTSTGLKDSVMGILQAIGTMAQKIWNILTGLFEGLATVIGAIVYQSLRTVAWLIQQASKLLGKLAKGANMHTLARVLKAAESTSAADLVQMGKDVGGDAFKAVGDASSKLKASITDAFAVGWKEGKEFITYGASKSWEGLKQAVEDSGALGLKDLFAKLLDMPKLSDGDVDMRYSESRQKEMAEADKEWAKFVRDLADMTRKANEEAAAEALAADREESSRFAEAMRGMREEAQRIKDAMEQARQALVDKIVGGLGQLGAIINAAAQGFEAGGVYGAVIAGFAELLMQSKGFADVITMLNGVIQTVADALGTILEPVGPLLGAIKLIIDAVFSVLTPVFEMLNEAIEPIVPPLVMVGKILQGLAPLLEAVAKSFMSVLDPLSKLAGPVMEALFGILKFVGIIILEIAIMLGDVWNAIVKAIQWVLRQISKAIEWMGIKALKNLANSLEGMKVNTDEMGRSLEDLKDTTWESADAQARQTAEVLRGTTALEKMTEALTNVPAAWKVAYRRFQAQDAADGPGTPTAPGSGTGGGGGTAREIPQWFLDFMALPDALRERREDRSRDPFMGGRSGGEYIPKTSAPVQSLKGPTYNLAINTIDADEGVERAVRFVRRVDAMTKLADSGRRISKSSRYGG